MAGDTDTVSLTEAAARLADVATPLFEEMGWEYGSMDRRWVPGWGELYKSVIQRGRGLQTDASVGGSNSGRINLVRNGFAIEVWLEVAQFDDPLGEQISEEWAAEDWASEHEAEMWQEANERLEVMRGALDRIALGVEDPAAAARETLTRLHLVTPHDSAVKNTATTVQP